MASKWKHRLSAIDESKKIAVCAHCGPVRIIKNGTRWKCTAARAGYNRDRRRRKRGMNYDGKAFAALIVEADGVCEICGEFPESGLVPDHDHDNGKVRGALCGRCNSGLGFFRDNPELLAAALRYLKEKGQPTPK
jgi:hypothetical protein